MRATHVRLFGPLEMIGRFRFPVAFLASGLTDQVTYDDLGSFSVSEWART